MERVEVPESATVADLRQAINEKLGVSLADMQLSRQAGLLTSKAPQEFSDLAQHTARLQKLGIANGEMIFMLYSGERVVQPAVKKTAFESRPFGASLTVEQIAAKQVRIERQEKPVVESVSFDRDAANMFQQYVNAALGFSIKRGGIMYGTVGEDNCVKVEFVYEPPQEGSAMHLKLQRGTDEEAQVDFLANLLGLKKVGFIFTQSTAERDFIMHTDELIQAATMQGELGETSMTVVVSWDRTADDPGGHVHFEAFQCSKQCVALTRDGWLQPTPEGTAPGGVTQMRNPKEPGAKDPVMVAGKDVGEVDNDYFLVPARILQHKGPLSTSFPIENRLLGQGKAEFREHMRKHSSLHYVERISDFHLLLWLSKQPSLDAHDMTLLVDAVRTQSPVLEGYKAIIDSIAGM